jgi:hypothetical protein
MMAQDKPYLRFHVDEVRFDGRDWMVAFTPRGITWEAKQARPVPDDEMRRIWKAEGVPVALDDGSVKQYWKQIENGVRDYLIREYWSLDGKK